MNLFPGNGWPVKRCAYNSIQGIFRGFLRDRPSMRPRPWSTEPGRPYPPRREGHPGFPPRQGHPPALPALDHRNGSIRLSPGPPWNGFRNCPGVNIRLHDLRRTSITIAESLDIPGHVLKTVHEPQRPERCDDGLYRERCRTTPRPHAEDHRISAIVDEIDPKGLG